MERRRTTMTVLTDSSWNTQNANNRLSKIPPPSAMNSRQSLAPRMSLNPRATPLNRQSVGYLSNELSNLNIQERRVSTKPVVADPRRSSVKMAPVLQKDPRNVRDRSFQHAMVKSLLQFLVDNNYSQPISQKLLSAPSGKDFQNIFLFLYSFLDPVYKVTKKFEEEVPLIMKSLKYPFASDISRSHLYAVGSPHAWPTLLAMLAWMVELIIATSRINPDLDDEADVDSEQPERFFYVYLSKAYVPYINSMDGLEDIEKEMASNFERKNEAILEEIASLEYKQRELEKEYEKLTSQESPLLTLEKQKSLFMSDIEKFKKFIKHLEAKNAKFQEQIAAQNVDIETISKEIAEYESLRDEYQSKIDAQSISVEDIDRMNAEKDQLTSAMSSLLEQKEALNKTIWEKEIELQKKLSNVEKTCKEYNYLGEKLSMIPMSAANSKGINFQINLNIQKTKEDEIFENNSILRNSLSKYRETLREIIQKIEEQLSAKNEELDRLTENCSDKKEELRFLEEKVDKGQQDYNEQKKDMIKANDNNVAQIDNLEAEIRKMKMSKSNVLASDQALKKIQLFYDQLVRSANEDKDRINRELYNIFGEVEEFAQKADFLIKDFGNYVSSASQDEF